jgi:hypothetical protein
MTQKWPLSRRALLAGAIPAVAAFPGRVAAAARPHEGQADDKALIAITLDLEMSRHYPTWDQMHWDYEKGNLDADTKRYALEASRRVKGHGGVIHFFAVGRVLEQENVDWLREIHRDGHPIGNHTYDHVNVKATQLDQVQFRFQRAPWLVEGKRPEDVIRDNIRLAGRALKLRLGIDARGFRTPGGFNNGLHDRPDVQRMLLDLGFSWVSSLYPAHPLNEPGLAPTAAILEGIIKAQGRAQPFTYPSGLVEVPMNPISDVSAMRAGRWKLEPFVDAVRRGVEWAIDHRGVYDFLGHPSCLVVADPEFRTIEMICELVKQAGNRAAIVGLDTVAQRATGRNIN